jgi:tetratricopeptide (TPR) repeat protein
MKFFCFPKRLLFNAVLILSFLFNFGYAGNSPKRDSLELVLKTAKGHQRIDAINKLIKLIYKDDLPKAKLYLNEAEALAASYPNDKVITLINKGKIALLESKDPEKALVYYMEALKLAEKQNYKEGLEQTYPLVGSTYVDLGKMDDAAAIYDAGLKKAEACKSIYLKAEIFSSIGVMEYYKGNLDGAMARFKMAIPEYEKINDKGNIAGITMNIGVMYYRTGKSKESLEYYEKALKVMREIGDTASIANALTNIGITESDLGKNEKAIERFEEAEKIYRAQKDLLGVANSYDNMAGCYINLGKKELTLKLYLKALKIKEDEKDERGYATSYMNIADISLEMLDTAKTLEYYQKALAITKKLSDEYRYAHVLRAIASVYTYQGKFESAEKLLDESISINKKLNDIPGLSTAYITFGNLYKKKNNLDEALKYYLDALKMKEEIGEKVSIAGLLSNIGVIYYDRKQFKESIKYHEKALTIRREIKNGLGVSDSYLALANSYCKMQDFRNAYEYQVKFHKAWDSIFNNNITKQIAEMNTKYETAEKDKEIAVRTAGEKEAKARAEREALESKNANQRFMYVAIGFILVLVLAIFTYRANLQRKKANALLESANNKLAESNDEIMNQKHLIEEKQKEILDSISYAKRLQEAILPPIALIRKHLPDSFVMYNPKDIVAGDFYWMEITKDQVLIAAADCTGHGVPGAMVSVVCSNALNRAVKEFAITEPGKILDKVRELVVETFGKSESEVKDGMDISICAISGTSIKWAGANNPLWYVQDGEMKKIVANKQPIGKTDNPQPFTTHHVQLKKNDILYLFTDGFADQFGGPNGKKYKTKQMEELFAKTISEKMETQEQHIQSAFQNWKGRLEQIDDVCIIGIRV